MYGWMCACIIEYEYKFIGKTVGIYVCELRHLANFTEIYCYWKSNDICSINVCVSVCVPTIFHTHDDVCAKKKISFQYT